MTVELDGPPSLALGAFFLLLTNVMIEMSHSFAVSFLGANLHLF